MPIYSKNRSGSMALEMAEPAKGYGMNSVGRILYETCINEKTLFDAMIDHDMKEIKGLKEGTILESELVSLNEKSIGEIFNIIKENLDKFWTKIKSVFKDAMNKISAYVLGDCKAFVTEFKKTKEAHGEGFTGTVSGKLPKAGYSILPKDRNVDIPSVINKHMRNVMNSADEVKIDKADVISETLGEIAGATGKRISPNDFRSYVMQAAFESKADVTLNSTPVKDAMDLLDKGLGTAIKTVKNLEVSTKASIDDMKTDLDQELKKNENNYEKNYQILISLVNAAQQILSTVVSTGIALEREKFASCRKFLGSFMAKMKSKNESTALVEAIIEIDNAFETAPMLEVSDEVKNFINSVEPDITISK